MRSAAALSSLASDERFAQFSIDFRGIAVLLQQVFDILDNIELRKESITGVNLDEELIQLTKYEQSYEAAARVLKTVEELTDTILDLVQGIY